MKRANIFIIALTSILFTVGCSGPARQMLVREETTAETDSLALDREFPVDPKIGVGTLENGVKYYIRPNQRPENRAELRLVVNAGSVLETDKQQGLAHFAEHMAFNGTRHFEKQELVDYLESIGMRFGPDINAYTSFDETVYMLQVPTDSTELVESGFRILEDWAHYVSFDSVEIEKERGVIIEEGRLGRGAQARMRDEQLPVLFHSSRYADRLPIGKLAVIDTFHQATLTEFYQEWYRPELLGVVAVGDFDPQWIDSHIREHFSGISTKPDAPEREVYPVPDHEETLFAIASDPEATRSSVSVYYKHDVSSEETIRDYRQMLVENLYNRMLNNRLNELTQEANPPFLYGYSSKGRLIRSKETYVLGAVVRDNGIERGLSALLTEAERVNQHGFAVAELEREKKAMLRNIEQAYNEREKTESGRYAAEYIRNFLYEEPIPGIEFEYNIYNRYIPKITLEEVNTVADQWITRSNRVILASLPEKEGVHKPTESDLLEVMDAVEQQEIAAYQDTLAGQQLMEERPAPSPVVSENTIDTLGVTEWRLANGIRVVLKPTTFKNDEIRFTAFSPGGLSRVPDSNYVAGQTATGVVTNAGVGKYTRVELEKLLADKVVNVRPYISELQEGLSGRASPEDMETLFQLIYLNLTSPRIDSSAYLSYQAQMRGYLENRNAGPETALSDTLQKIVHQNHFRARPWSMNMLSEMDMQKSFQIYRNRFADTGDFTFIFVGNFAPGDIRPLVESYLGALSDLPGEEQWKDNGMRYTDKRLRIQVKKGLEPKSRVQMVFTGSFDWSRENRYVMNAMVEVLRIKLREVLREDLGGTYGVGIGASAAERPVQDYRINISFGCNPDRVEELTQAVMRQIDSLKTCGTTEEYLAKVKEIDRRSRETNLRENGFWLNHLEFYYDHGEDPRTIYEYDALVRSLTAEDIQNAAQRYFNEGHSVIAVLYPEDYES